MITKYEEYNKLIKCLLLFLFCYSVAFSINNYFRPFLIIVFFIFLCNPLYKSLNRVGIFSKRIAALISILVINVLLISLLLLLGNFFITKLNNFLINDYSNFANGIQNIIDELNANTKINFTNISQKVEEHYYNILNKDFLQKGAVYTTDGVLAYFIGNISAYFILVDRNAILNTISKVIPGNKYKVLLRKCEEFNKLLSIELILVFVTTLETILGFLALNISNAFILGIFCGILDIIPLIGIIIVFIPLILIQLTRNNYIIAAGLLILYILLQVIRQIMEAKFVGNTLKIHPVLIIISIYIGLKLCGIIGVFLGPLYIISAKEILEI